MKKFKWLGSKERPCLNNSDINYSMRGRTNCTLYLKGEFEISKENLMTAKFRNITLKYITQDEPLTQERLNIIINDLLKKQKGE